MKVKAQFFVKRIDGKIVEAESISDMYSEVSVVYTSDEITQQDIVDAMDKILTREAIGKYISDLFVKGEIHLQSEAKNMFSIGKVKVGIEEVEVELN